MLPQTDWYVTAKNAGISGIISDDTKICDITKGGQIGVGAKYTQLDSSTPALFNPTTFIVTGMPTMWDNIPGGKKLQYMLKALVETHAKNITGTAFSYSTDPQKTVVGHDGQEASVPSQTKRSAVNPVFQFQELVGLPVYNIGRRWLFDMSHPDTNMSLMSAQLLNDGSANDDGTMISPFLYSSFSMSMLGIQYGPTGRPDDIMDAALYTNMFPIDIGENDFERTHGDTKIKERQWTMTGIVQHNSAIKDMATEIAKLISAHRVDYNYATPAFKMEQALASRADDNTFGGWKYDIETMLAHYTKQATQSLIS